MYHPWRDLRRREDVYVVWHANLPDGMHAATDGRIIHMVRGLSQAQRRSALAHELVHIDRGHSGCQPPDVERDVTRAAARRLVTFDDLVDTGTWATSVGEWADDLWVTPTILHARIDCLSPVERALLAALIKNAQDDAA